MEYVNFFGMISWLWIISFFIAFAVTIFTIKDYLSTENHILTRPFHYWIGTTIRLFLFIYVFAGMCLSYLVFIILTFVSVFIR